MMRPPFLGMGGQMPHPGMMPSNFPHGHPMHGGPHPGLLRGPPSGPPMLHVDYNRQPAGIRTDDRRDRDRRDNRDRDRRPENRRRRDVDRDRPRDRDRDRRREARNSGRTYTQDDDRRRQNELKNAERAFKRESITLGDTLTPKMADGPMNLSTFFEIIRKQNLEQRHHVILFCIIKLGEPALALEYLKSVPGIKDILNSPIPTRDRWLIHRAAWQGNVRLLEHLIDFGISSDRLNGWGELPDKVVESAVEQGQYGMDQAEKLKDLLLKANTAPPPPPPRAEGAATSQAMNPGMELIQPYPGASMQMPQISAEIMEAAQKMAQQMLPWMMSGMNVPAVGAEPGAEEVAWLKALKTSSEQTHCFVSRIAFEADEADIRAFFEQCGEIAQFHMPRKNLAKKNASFGTVVNKLQQDACHQGKAVILFKDKGGLEAALRANGDAIKGRAILITRSAKVTKARKKEEREQTETERLLGKYAKKNKGKGKGGDVVVERPPEGDKTWLDKLVPGPDQTHCFVSGIAFEAAPNEVKKLFKKCGEVFAFHMHTSTAKEQEEKGGTFDTIAKKLNKGVPHRGKAVVLFRTLYGLRAAMHLNDVPLRGRNLQVSRGRRKAPKLNSKTQAKKEAKKRKFQEDEDARAQMMPSDIDDITLAGTQISEVQQAEEWTQSVQQKMSAKLDQVKPAKRRKTGTMPAVVPKPKSDEPEMDDFERMLMEHTRNKAARSAPKLTAPAGPAARSAPEPAAPADPAANPMEPESA